MKHIPVSFRGPAAFLIVITLSALACSAPARVSLLATPTPTHTATATPSPTPTPLPTATQTPTPPPASLLNLGESELFLGDFEQARQEYQAALAAGSDAETQSSAVVGMGKALFYQNNLSTAINTFKSAIESYPGTAALAEAWYFMGESYAAQQAYLPAADAYQQYLALRPAILAGYIQSQRGDLLLAANDGAGAAAAYAEALRNDPPGDPVWLRLKLSQALTAQKDFKGAVTLLLDIYQISTNDYARAQADWLLGQTYLILGEPEQAQARFMDAVINFPSAYDSYAGLIELVNSNVQVSDLNRGIVDFYAGQYSLCAEALNRYLQSTKPEDASANYYRALCLRETKDYQGALTDFDTVIKNFSGDRFWSRAFDEKAFTQWAYLDQFEPGAETLLDYSSQAGDAQAASTALFEAGRIYERGNMLEKAAQTWEQLINTFPTAENSYRALFLAGVSSYRMKDYPRARTIFQRALVLASEPKDQAAAYLWIGKTQQIEGDQSAATQSWEQAVQRDPTGYYSQRAAELLIGRAPFSSATPFDLGYNLNAERNEAETWLRTTFDIPGEVDLSGLGELAQDPSFLRGQELTRLGRYAEARDEFETLRKAAAKDPAQTYRLMSYLLEHNYYRSAILSSRQILDLAGMDDAGTLRAPRFFNHIRFGVYFRDLVTQATQEQDLNPLFLLSVLRQESLFEPFAQSGAGARGLMQIMPSTAQEIATQLNWPPDFQTTDLSRPSISIPMGAYYLARQQNAFSGSLFSTLAAYNGGPGNTIAWLDLAGDDPDLFLEVIRASETRTYIMQIYEYYNHYRLIYEQTP